jgi:hypothetical protein
MNTQSAQLAPRTPPLNAAAHAALAFMLERYPAPLRQFQICDGLPQIGLDSSAALEAFMLLQVHGLVRMRRLKSRTARAYLYLTQHAFTQIHSLQAQRVIHVH